MHIKGWGSGGQYPSRVWGTGVWAHAHQGLGVWGTVPVKGVGYWGLGTCTSRVGGLGGSTCQGCGVLGSGHMRMFMHVCSH